MIAVRDCAGPQGVKWAVPETKPTKCLFLHLPCGLPVVVHIRQDTSGQQSTEENTSYNFSLLAESPCNHFINLSLIRGCLSSLVSPPTTGYQPIITEYRVLLTLHQSSGTSPISQSLLGSTISELESPELLLFRLQVYMIPGFSTESVCILGGDAAHPPQLQMV